MNNAEKFKRCEEIARAMYPKVSNRKENYHLTFVWRGGKIISIGENSNKTHTINVRYNKKINRYGVDISDSKGSCSELNAYIKLRNNTNMDYSKLTMINIRINRNGSLDNSHPCPSCKNLIKFISPKKCYHTNSLGTFQEYSCY